MKATKILSLLFIATLMLTACGSQSSRDNQGGQIGMPNPASVYCEEQGGQIEMRENARGTYGVCIFPDGSECDEWAYYRGECSPAGVIEENEEPAADDLTDNTSFSMDVVAVYGTVISTSSSVPAESLLQLSPEGFGSIFINGETGEIENQIRAIRDKSAPSNHANFWGHLNCPSMDTCLLTVTSMRVDGPGDFPVDPVEAWEGVIYSGPSEPHSGGDDYFALLGPLPFQYGIDSADEALRQQLEDLRDTGQPIRIWGEIYAGRMDWNATQIMVTKIEYIQADPSVIPAPPNW
ncbi:MAG: DUF333 domain-containing protein [Anaerolineales bacterium]